MGYYFLYLFLVTWQFFDFYSTIWLFIDCYELVFNESSFAYCIIRSLGAYLSTAKADVIIDSLINLDTRSVIGPVSWAFILVRTLTRNSLIFLVFFAEANFARYLSLSSCFCTHFDVSVKTVFDVSCSSLSDRMTIHWFVRVLSTKLLQFFFPNF